MMMMTRRLGKCAVRQLKSATAIGTILPRPLYDVGTTFALAEHLNLKLVAYAFILCSRNKLKLHAGELVLVDRLGNEFDHFLLFHVCEILRITITREVNKHGDITDEEQVMLEVGVLKRCVRCPSDHVVAV